jgi:transposase InsO family protein
MPWKVSSPVSERMTFISRLKAGERMADLCREYGISRKTGYKLAERFDRLGPIGLYDASRKPQRLARKKPEAVRRHFIEARAAHPTWGSRKLRAWIEKERPGVPLPAASTIHDWLEVAGLVKPRRRRSATSPYAGRLGTSDGPNDIWCIDYKGQFRLGNGRYCYPLTVTDHFSRSLLACEGFEAIEGKTVRAVLEEAFAVNGLPQKIRSDNGSPFASRGLFGLSQLSVWWLKLGIVPERIEPGHPEQNGRHERMHRTLKAETTRPAGATLLQQQERFDAFRDEFNRARPHEALGMKPPSSVYQPSARRLSAVGELEYPFHDEVVRVGNGGHARVLTARRGNVFLSEALAGERVGIRELSDGRLLVTYASLDLGVVDPQTRKFMRADREANTASDTPQASTACESPLELPSTHNPPMKEIITQGA